MDLERIHDIAREALAHRTSHVWKEPGNKFYHGERTAILARRLLHALFPGYTQDDDVLTVAAWFHDLRNGEEHHEELGAREARRLLEPYCTSDELRRITRIILRHDDRDSPRSEFAPAELVHQDADLLDHFGCYDIWMTFLQAAYEHRTPDETARGMHHSHGVVYDYWRPRLNYALSVRIFEEKLRFFSDFSDRFSLELAGDVAGWDELLRCTPDLIGDRGREGGMKL